MSASLYTLLIYFRRATLLIFLILFVLQIGVSSATTTHLFPGCPTFPIPIVPDLACQKALQVDAHYDHQHETLHIDVSIHMTQALHWSLWVVSHGDMTEIASMDLPEALERPLSLPVSIPLFPPQGRIGILSTLTTPFKGIACSTYDLVETGVPFFELRP